MADPNEILEAIERLSVTNLFQTILLIVAMGLMAIIIISNLPKDKGS